MAAPEIAMIKVAVPNMAQKVIDNAIQVCLVRFTFTYLFIDTLLFNLVTENSYDCLLLLGIWRSGLSC